MNRRRENSSMLIVGSLPIIRSDVSFPIAGPSNIPFLPVPVAMYAPCKLGMFPSIIFLSVDIGLRQAVWCTIRALSSSGSIVNRL